MSNPSECESHFSHLNTLFHSRKQGEILLNGYDALLLVSPVAAGRDESNGVWFEVILPKVEVAGAGDRRGLHQGVHVAARDEVVAELHRRLSQDVHVRLTVRVRLGAKVENLEEEPITKKGGSWPSNLTLSYLS